MNISALLRRYSLPLFAASAYLFLYAPIIVLVLFSFNEVAFPYRWVAFSTQWYVDLWYSAEVWQAAYNSLIVATTSSLLALMLSLLWVFYGSHSKLKSLEAFFYINLMIPEIVGALGLLTLFHFFSIPLSLMTLIAGHTLLGLGYAIPIISASFAEIDYSIIEASLDLGASLHQTFWKVIIPVMMPALIAAGLLVFIISLDDFLISFFCAGGDSQTLSLYIFATIRTGISPTINALSTILLVVSSFVVMLFSFVQVKVKIF